MRTAQSIVAFISAALLISTASGRLAAQPDRQNALASLVEAERAFSKTSEEKGLREAFLTWLAPDAIVFRPAPVEGRPVYEKMDPADPAVLTWEPEFAEIASSGELGYTTGPYRIKPGPGAEPSGFGHYVSIWKRQPDGAWRVLLDIGVQHGPPASPAGTTTAASPTMPAPAEPLPPDALRDVEYAFGLYAGTFDKEVALKGLPKALAAFAAEDVRVYRPGGFPAVGLAAAKRMVPADEGKADRKGLGPGSPKISYKVGISWAGDLAYTYGTAGSGKTGATEGSAAFLRIWRRDASGHYKIRLDIRLPVPPEAAN